MPETTNPFLIGTSLTIIKGSTCFGFEGPKSEVKLPNLIIVESVSEAGPVTSALNSHQAQPAKDAAKIAPQVSDSQEARSLVNFELDEAKPISSLLVGTFA